ncbi:Hypothetical_protein [Hexamita inflata]|uniref:Hypothetical_protein n=1 Tax=Hexamita inflata TaxID=28002 RepID=A0ABP1HPW4_9EUKA
MPFDIISNDEQLSLELSETYQHNQVDIQVLNQTLNIKGFNKSSIFDYYETINQSRDICIFSCCVDLSQFKGSFNKIEFQQCECIGEFMEHCQVKAILLKDVSIQVWQIINLQYYNLSCQINQNNSFDYQNCNILTSTLKELSINNQLVNLSQMKGNWETVKFFKCDFAGYFFDDFRAENILVTLSENNQFNTYNIYLFQYAEICKYMQAISQPSYKVLI